MRILFLNPGASLGGAERCLIDLLASIRATPSREKSVLGLIAAGDGPLASEAEALGVHVVRLPLGERMASVGDSAILSKGGTRALASFTRRLAYAGLDIPGYLRRLQRAIHDFQPSIVHSNGIKMHLLAAPVCDRAPLVWHIRDFIGDRPLVSRAMRAVASRAAMGIAISNGVAEDARRIMPRLPISVVHDAIDTDTFSPIGPSADLDRLAGTSPSGAHTVRVGLVATYARWKGHEVFLQAIRQLKETAGMPATHFYVVGGPIYDTEASQYREDELRQFVETLGIVHLVTFVPFQMNVQDVYRSLDIVVHASSRREPFGRTIAEAMATGKAVVASRDSGAAELFVDGVDALATTAREPGALASAIRSLIADPSRRQAVGLAARATAVARFSRGRLAAQLFDIYREAGCAVSE